MIRKSFRPLQTSCSQGSPAGMTCSGIRHWPGSGHFQRFPLRSPDPSSPRTTSIAGESACPINRKSTLRQRKATFVFGSREPARIARSRLAARAGLTSARASARISDSGRADAGSVFNTVNTFISALSEVHVRAWRGVPGMERVMLPSSATSRRLKKLTLAMRSRGPSLLYFPSSTRKLSVAILV